MPKVAEDITDFFVNYFLGQEDEEGRKVFPTKYLVSRVGIGEETAIEACNYEGLYSRIVKYFSGHRIKDLRVIRVLPKFPYFREVSKEAMNRLYGKHKRLERLAS